MHVKRAASGGFVQRIDVLGDEGDRMARIRLEPRERVMGGVGPGLCGLLPAHGVKGMDPGRIAPVCLWGRHIFYPEARPKPARIAESAEPAFGRDARPR